MSDRGMRADPGPDADAECRELASAMEAYRQSSGRMFPTWSEILEVLIDLGYRKPDVAREAPEGMPVSGRARYLVRIDADCTPARVHRIAVMIESRGGRRSDAKTPEFFAFPTESARATALAAVRRTFGWTVVHSA